LTLPNDHIHIYTPDRLIAEQWHKNVLGFERIESLEKWFDEGGPLTIGNDGVKIALFESDSLTSTTVAFLVDAKNYALWKEQLKTCGVNFYEMDHDLS